MRRWHSEVALMHRRWRMEMEKHDYDWRCPPTDKDACHCASGIGSVRKKKPFDCGNPRCGICHGEKFFEPKRRANIKRAAIEYDLRAH